MLIAALLKIMSQLGIPCIVVGSDGDLLILECDGGTVVRCLQPVLLVLRLLRLLRAALT
jgi:hypothetical protein